MRRNKTFTIELKVDRDFRVKVFKEREKQDDDTIKYSASNRVQIFMEAYSKHGEKVIDLIKKMK